MSRDGTAKVCACGCHGFGRCSTCNRLVLLEPKHDPPGAPLCPECRGVEGNPFEEEER